MKKIVLMFIAIMLIAASVEAAVELSAQTNRVYQLAASGFVSSLITAANALNLNFRSQNDIFFMKGWLMVESGASGSIALVFHGSVFNEFLRKFEGFAYGTTAVSASCAQPTNCAPAGSDVTCDDPGDQTLYLFSWNSGTQLFTDTEDTPSCATGTCTFSAPGSGTYVVSRGATYLPSTFLTVP